MKSKKKTRILVAVILLIILIATGFTFSRYSTVITGALGLDLAQWKFDVTTNDGAPISNIVLKTSDGSSVAPGTNGSFEINVDATGSGVDIAYRAEANSVKVPQNMRFYLAGEGEPNYQSIDQIIDGSIQGNLFAGTSQQSKKYVICWDWPMDGNDPIPADGTIYGVGITISAQQI